MASSQNTCINIFLINFYQTNASLREPPSYFTIIANTWHCDYHFVWRMALAAVKTWLHNSAKVMKLYPSVLQPSVGLVQCNKLAAASFSERSYACPDGEITTKAAQKRLPLQEDLVRVAKILLFGTKSETKQQLSMLFVLIKIIPTHFHQYISGM